MSWFGKLLDRVYPVSPHVQAFIAQEERRRAAEENPPDQFAAQRRPCTECGTSIAVVPVNPAVGSGEFVFERPYWDRDLAETRLMIHSPARCRSARTRRQGGHR